MLVNIPKIGNANLYGYKYDQLNRIKSMDAFIGINNADNSFTAVSGQSYKERVTYDANGNILTYKRNGDNARLSMDEMTYTYKPNTNQLDKVVDIAPDASLIDYNKYRDIKQGQQNGNYQYDAIGNLIADVSEGITNIKWNVYGKIQEINKNGSLISYTYDASGNRISKTADGKTTWYVRDASGNVMSVYTVDAAVNSGHLTQSEVNLYGSSRLGIWNANKDIAVTPNTNYFRGNKWFELSNHLGNVLATITDKRLPHTSNNSTIDYYEADISTANDYYLGGMQMKGHSYTLGNQYRIGFNGHEKDNEVSGEGNHLAFGDYGYDTRLGRRWNIEPLIKKYPSNSSYLVFGNNPILFADPDGQDRIITHTVTKEYGNGKTRTITTTITYKGLDSYAKREIYDAHGKPTGVYTYHNIRESRSEIYNAKGEFVGGGNAGAFIDNTVEFTSRNDLDTKFGRFSEKYFGRGERGGIVFTSSMGENNEPTPPLTFPDGKMENIDLLIKGISQVGATIGIAEKPDNILEAIRVLKDGLETGDNLGDAVNDAKKKLSKTPNSNVSYCEAHQKSFVKNADGTLSNTESKAIPGDTTKSHGEKPDRKTKTN